MTNEELQTPLNDLWYDTAVETCRGTSLHTIEFIERGEMEIKGKGLMRTFFLEKANQ